MTFDDHAHGRDGPQDAQETLSNLGEVAYAGGVDAVALMPNTKVPLTTLELCKDYLRLVPRDAKVRIFVHIGLTPNREQVKRAVEATRKDPQIIGMKAYFGRSTGDLSVVEDDEQRLVWRALAEEGYDGVVVGHCEQESLMQDKLYDPRKPRTWSTVCRPEIAEVTSFNRQVLHAEEAGFKGKFHVAHVSTTDVVDMINSYSGKVRLSCGVTPHHLFLDDSHLELKEVGAHYKCNPPLRRKKTQEGLLERLLTGKIPIVESDHAPHLESAKRSDAPPSGISNATAWPFVMEELQRRGMSEALLRDVTHNNPCALYGVQVEHSGRTPDYKALERLQGKYAFDAFAHLKQK